MANLMSVKYIGHLAEVDVDLDGLGERSVVHGEVVQVPEQMAKSLLEQHRNWEYVPVVNSKKPEEANK